jgi:membrane-bound serine protease (ClpP class)
MRLVCLLLVLMSVPVTMTFGGESRIRVVAIDGPVNPVTVDYLRRNLKASDSDGDRLVLLEMDTPGGLDSAMREIVKEIIASRTPVVVHVTPAGARAASAGAVIALAADICAMSPGTNIGAAHPVTIGGKPDKIMSEKLVNDAEAYVEGIALKRGRDAGLAKRMVRDSLSLPAEKALAGHLIDLLASDQADLLRKLEGRRVAKDGREVFLQLTGAKIVVHEMGARERILSAVSNPNVAYVLMMLGFIGLFFELSSPGVILPGVIGGISLLLAFFAFQSLPVNYAGVLLIIMALIFFIAEVKVVSNGMLTVGGVIAMIFGSLMLFESPEPYLRVSWSVIIPTVLAVTVFFLFAVTKAVEAHRKKPTTGSEGLLGEQGLADSAIAPEGKVFVRGEYWDAWSDEDISRGEKVMVVAVEGLRLKVKKQ